MMNGQQMPERFVNRSDVMRFLRISGATATRWQTSGFLVPSKTTRLEVLYDHADIDSILAAGAHNFDSPPTVAAMQSGELELMLLSEVLDYFAQEPAAPHARDTLVSRITKDGAIAAVHVGEHWRCSRASVEAYKAAYNRSQERHIARADAAFIMGVSKHTLYAQVIKPGRVAVADSSVEGRDMRPLLRDSFIAYLRTLLPDWITPQEWIALRYTSGRQLVTKPQAEDLLGFDHHGELIQALFDEQELRYIRTPGGANGKQRVLVTQESIMAHLHQWPILDNTQLAQIFAVSPLAVQNWRATKRLMCILHPQHHMVLRKACVIGLLRRWLTGRISARVWYQARLESPKPALDETTAAAALGWTPEQVRAAAESGRIKGLYLPNRTWRFSPEQISDVRRSKA